MSAQSGIEMITSRMMDWAAQRKLCRLVIINKIDAENVDLPEAVLDAIQATFGKECLPINLPADGGKRVVDCFFNPAGESDFSSVADAHRALVDQVVEVDEELDVALPRAGRDRAGSAARAIRAGAARRTPRARVLRLRAHGRRAWRSCSTCWSSSRPIPPRATRRSSSRAKGRRASEFHSVPDPKKHVLAHVFKVVIDPFIGKLGIFRVHQGTVTKDTQLFVGDSRKPFKVGHLLACCRAASRSKSIARCLATSRPWRRSTRSNSTAFCTTRTTRTTSTCARSSSRRRCTVFAIAPKKRGDEQRISDVLHKMIAEDPTLIDRARGQPERDGSARTG